MARMINGEVLMDDNGNLNEQVLINSWIELYDLLHEEQEHED